MSSELLTAPEREGKTFNVAIRVLGVVAVFQVFLATFSVLIRFKGGEIKPGQAPGLPAVYSTAAPAGLPEAGGKAPLPNLPAPGPVPGSPRPAGAIAPDSRDQAGPADSPPEFQVPAGQMLLAQNRMPEESAAGLMPNHIAHRISLPEVAELVSRALLLREQGDTQGALEALRQADAKLPSHPKILAEIATTFQQLGLVAKAAAYWERVHQMRPEGAGAYWDLADMALKGQVLDDASPLDTYLRITRHTARTLPASDGSQHLVLRIHIEAAPGQTVSGNEMYLNVLFYDTVNDHAFEPTVADTKPLYLSQPYDWKNGAEEIIDVEYFLPKLNSEQLATLGQRRFFGYVVELYYKDLLQDIVASPRRLARLGSSASRAARPIRQSLPGQP